MKIGFFLPNATFDLPGSAEVGGIETFTFVVGEALQRLGHEVVLFGGRPKAGRAYRPTTLRVELFDYVETSAVPDLGKRFRRLIQRLHFGWSSRQAWLTERFDLALVAKPFDWPVAWVWKRRQAGLTVVMGFHGTDFFAGDRWFYPAVDHEFAVSAAVADLAHARVQRRPIVIHNSTDTHFFRPPAARAPLSRPFTLVATGRLVGSKGFDRLVAAVGAVRRAGRDLVCRIAGDGSRRAELERAIAEQHLTGTVELIGRLGRDQLRDLLWDGDAFVAPSVGLDAFSLATVEAACTGLPLLLSDQVGVREMLAPADFICYPARDVDALAKGIGTLISRRADSVWNDRDARHARMIELFSPEHAARRILALLERPD